MRWIPLVPMLLSCAPLATMAQSPRPALTWSGADSMRVRFYLSPEAFVAHATGAGAVLIPVSRVKERLAPFLHEAAHELLAPHSPFTDSELSDPVAAVRTRDAIPLWLFEGIPGVLAQTTAPLERHATRSMDAVRRAWLERLRLAPVDSSADLRAFRRILDDLQMSFERRDAGLFVKHFAADGDFMQAFGRYRGTREGTRDFMERFFSLQSERFVSTEVGTRVRRVGDDVAFVEAEFTGEGIRNADGSVQPPRRGQMLLLLERRDGTWQVLSYRYLDIHGGALRARS